MTKSNSLENSWLLLLLNNTNIANVGDATGLRGSTTAGSLYLSLHTADPGEAGDQTTNEIGYTSYARAAVARSAGGWTVSGNSATLTSTISFPAGTGGSGTALFWGLGTASSGAGVLLYSGAIGSVLGAFTGATSGNAITIPASGAGNGLAVDDRVSFYAVFGKSIPAGLTEGTVYFVKTVSGDTITVATTSGGAAVTITASGDGVAFKHTPLVTGTGVTPQLNTSTTISED